MQYSSSKVAQAWLAEVTERFARYEDCERRIMFLEYGKAVVGLCELRIWCLAAKADLGELTSAQITIARVQLACFDMLNTVMRRYVL